MKPLKILLLTIVTLFTITGCCWTDHSKEIKKIAEPMAKELEAFYKKQKRFPANEEMNMMLEKVGCEMDGDICKFQKKNLKINSQTTSYSYWYDLEIENTYCTSFMDEKGSVYDIWCQNKPCIDIDH